MYRLQLFEDAQSIQPIDARILGEGTLTIGRDPGAQWTITDPDCALSRFHCELLAQSTGLFLRPTGTNGVFDDHSGNRYSDHLETLLDVPCAISLGRFRIVVTSVAQNDVDMGANGTMILTPPIGNSLDIPTDWSDAPTVGPSERGSLLEAFCRGAGLDSSQLSDEDPEEIMERVGAIYRQMILGIGDLMAERDHARARYQMNRTTIGGTGNNPFKWAPTQRLALDLILSGPASFLSGATAVQASFRDIKRHLVATFAGLQGCLRSAIDTFAPGDIEGATKEDASFFKNRAALQMQEVARRHQNLVEQLEQGMRGSLDRAFTAQYDAAEAEQGSHSGLR